MCTNIIYRKNVIACGQTHNTYTAPTCGAVWLSIWHTALTTFVFCVLFCFVFNSSKLSWTNRYIFVSPYVYNEWICFALIWFVFRLSLILLLRHNSIALYRSRYFRISRLVHTWFRHIIISQVISYSFEEAFKLIHIFVCVILLFCLYLSVWYKLAVHHSSSIIPSRIDIYDLNVTKGNFIKWIYDAYSCTRLRIHTSLCQMINLVTCDHLKFAAQTHTRTRTRTRTCAMEWTKLVALTRKRKKSKKQIRFSHVINVWI